jgi:hypothetical protein
VHHLAQVNVARLRAPLDDPAMREFTTAVAPIHRLARTSPGFVWQLRTDAGHGVCVQPEEGGPVFLNLTVWRDYESLHAFTYRGPHAGYLKRKARWFVATPQPSTALWWLPAGRTPVVEDALARLRHLRSHGPTPRAFSLRRRFDPDGRPLGAVRAPHPHGRGHAPVNVSDRSIRRRGAT